MIQRGCLCALMVGRVGVHDACVHGGPDYSGDDSEDDDDDEDAHESLFGVESVLLQRRNRLGTLAFLSIWIRVTATGGSWQVRPFVASDVAAVGQVYLRSWRAAFGHILTCDVVSDAALLTMSRALVQAPTCVVVTSTSVDGLGDTVVGFAAGGDSAGHLDVLYMDPSAWGTGAAVGLLTVATDRLASGGATPWLWVWELNARALAFYARHGWRDTGETRSRVVGGHVFCYRRLSASSPTS